MSPYRDSTRIALAAVRSEWLPVALGALLATAALVVWIQRDGMMDREEANHVLRAIDTYDAAFGSGTAPLSVRRLLKARIDQVKPWYGWPAYMPLAVFWKVLGRTYDNGVWPNILFLTGICLLAGAIGFWFDPRSAPLMVLFHALLPGALVWAHFFNVTLAVIALAYLAVLTLLIAGSWQRPGWAAIAGLVCGVVTIAKSPTAFFWAPVAVVTVCRAMADRSRRFVALKSLAVFAVGLLPTALHFAINWEPLRFWAGHVHDLYRSEFTWRAFKYGAHMRPYEILLPFHLALVALGLIVLLAGRGKRWLALGLVLWPVPTIVGVFLMGGFPGTTRDLLPLALPAALLASLGAARLPRSVRIGLLWSLCGYGCLFLAVNFFGWNAGTGGSLRFRWLQPAIDGAPTIRLRPHPPLIDATVKGLRGLIPAGTEAACACLPATPYPIRSGDPRPTVLLDHVLLGPENITAHFALAGGAAPWNVGYVPYPLPLPLLQTAISCAAVVLIGEGAMKSEFMGAEERAAERRPLLENWGQAFELGAWPGFGRLTARRTVEAPLCRVSQQSGLDAWLRPKTGNMGEGAYYGRYLELVVSGGDPAALASEVATTGKEAEERLRRLNARADPAATIFGEEYLVRDVLGSLAQMRLAESGDSTSDEPPRAGTIWLQRGTALSPAASRPLLTDRGFTLTWDEPHLPRRLALGEPLVGTVVVVNRSPETWPSLREARGPAYAVRLGCRILDASGTEVSAPPERGEIPGAVAPGAKVAIPYSIQPPKQRGAYRLECDLVQELHSWFSPHGNPKMTMDFTVE